MDQAGQLRSGPTREHDLDGSGGVPQWRRALSFLWLGQVVSHLGDSLFLVSIVYLALEVTGSRSKSGLLVAMNFLPALALGLFAGAFVDRHDRQRIMIGADLLRAATVGAIPVLYMTGHLGALGLAAAVFGLATGTTVFNPAIKALVPEIAPLDRLTSAAAAFQISEYIALVIGPAMAALVLPRLGMVHLFTIDAFTFLFSAVCLMLIPREARRRMHANAHSSQIHATARGALMDEVRVGLQAVRRSPVLRVVLVLAALDNLIIMGLAQVGTPLLIKETLGLGVDAYARAQAVFFLGLAIASAGVWLASRTLPKGRMILIGIVLDGLTFVPLAFCHTLAQVQLTLFIHAVAIPLIIIPRTVLIQQTIPGPLHGRTFALLNVTVFGMTAISAAVVGVLADLLPVQKLFAVFGLVGMIPGLVGFTFSAVRSAR